MINCKELNKDFNTERELFDALKENKSLLVATKKKAIKQSDTFMSTATKTTANKALGEKNDVLRLSLVINSTNVIDSHNDVHIKGIWNKTLQEVKNLYLLQEHKMQFDKIITDKVKAYTNTVDFTSLGYEYEGDTELLVFDVEIYEDRNKYMYNQYKQGYVKNHSVGMQYVKIELAINSDSRYDEEEKGVWDKYIGEIANKEVAEELGYFWAVTEAKLIEGSAVPIGSNTITPVLTDKAANDSTLNTEPSPDTQTKQLLTNLINKF